MSFSYTNFLLLREIQLPEKKTTKNTFWAEGRFNKRQRGGRSIGELKRSTELEDEVLLWLMIELPNKARHSMDQTQMSLDYFYFLHHRSLAFNFYEIPREIFDELNIKKTG